MEAIFQKIFVGCLIFILIPCNANQAFSTDWSAAIGASTPGEGNEVEAMELKEAVRALVSSRVDRHSRATNALVVGGKQSVEPLIDALSGKLKFDQRKRVGTTLMLITKATANRDSALLAQLLNALETGESAVASVLLPAIAEFKADSTASAALRRIAKENKNPDTRALAFGTLYVQVLAPRSEFAVFKAALSDPDERVQLVGARLLGRLGDRSGLGTVLEVVRRPVSASTDFGLLVAAANAAEAIGDSSLIPHLEQILRDPNADHISGTIHDALAEIRFKNLTSEDAQIRFLAEILSRQGHGQWAASRLAQSGSNRALEILKRAADDPGHPAHEDAAHALRWVKGQSK